jgi:three-Cys-motif partner protein
MAKPSQRRWLELCELVAEPDGLPTKDDVGKWTEDKLFSWYCYMDMTTRAMVDNPSWSGGLAYVDLFGGTGICVRDNGKRIPGSALLAVNTPKPFGNIIACEEVPELADALDKRLNKFGVRDSVIVGDCNAEIDKVVARIPPRALTLAFIDPEGLHINFETLRTLTTGRQIDLNILFPDRMDIARNVELYASQTQSNLDRFLGPNTNWREQWRALPNQSAENICQLFCDIYKSQLETLGFTEIRDVVFRAGSQPIYRIIYASKHPLGGKFWDEISKIDRGGQQSFGF